MSRPQLVLASASPRRKHLLESACFEVEVRPTQADESWPEGESNWRAGACELARRKMAQTKPDPRPTVSADTIVVAKDEILGKPVDDDDARRMLKLLSDQDHLVITGFCVRHGEHSIEGAVQTKVRFRELSDAEIQAYLLRNEHTDKAGAYAIQGPAGAFVDVIEGSYTNVVGLPLREVIEAVSRA